MVAGGVYSIHETNDGMTTETAISTSSSTCDLNFAGVCNTFDIDHLTLAIANGNKRFDNQPFYYDLNSEWMAQRVGRNTRRIIGQHA